ncbi:hypothetical protein [Brevibacillus sp. FIR094]|uniref:hypothetical protein n=1 Tax=Brevibacillus sp. FIR094 TaxID=3134809 RepID=UPI003D1A2A0F
MKKRSQKISCLLAFMLLTSSFPGSFIAPSVAKANSVAANSVAANSVAANSVAVDSSTLEGVIEGVFGVFDAKFGYPIKNPVGSAAGPVLAILNIVSAALDYFLDKDSVENGRDDELQAFLPPSFGYNQFNIIAYNPYATKGLMTDNPTSSSDEVVFRVKVYSEFGANEPTEYVLRNLEQITIPTNSSTQNLILEFYDKDADTPFERYYLPASQHNKDKGIALTKAKSKNNVFYLEKETELVSNLVAMLAFVGGDGRRYLDLSTAFSNGTLTEERMEQLRRKTRNIGKSAMTDSNLISNESIGNLLNVWKSPTHLLRGNPDINYGSLYHGQYTQNTQKLAQYGSLKFENNGKTTYQMYIPKPGFYKMSFQFAYDQEMNFKVKNVKNGALLEDIKRNKPDSSQKVTESSAPREIKLNQGVLVFEVEGSSFDLDAITFQYSGPLSDAEQSKRDYIAERVEAARLDTFNVLDYANRNSGTKEALEDTLSRLNYNKTNLVNTKNDLIGREYSSEELLMQTLEGYIEQINHRISITETLKNNVPDEINIKIEAENYFYGSDGVEKRGTHIFIPDKANNPYITFDFTVPKTGRYKIEYLISTDQWFKIRMYEGFKEVDYLMQRGSASSLDAPVFKTYTSIGNEVYLQEGYNLLNMKSEDGSFLLDEINLKYIGE